MISELLNWIQATSLSVTIRRSDWDVMVSEAVHLLGLSLLGGAVTIQALAALRHEGLKGLKLPVLLHQLRPLLITGLVLMVVSGTLIAWSMPYRYYLNPAFRAKMVLLVLALGTTLWLARTGVEAVATRRLRAVALLSWLLWLCVGVSGRTIGYL